MTKIFQLVPLLCFSVRHHFIKSDILFIHEKERQVIRHCSMSLHTQPQPAFPSRHGQLIQCNNRHSSNFLTLLKMCLAEFLRLLFDCSPTTSLGGWRGDLFLCWIHKQAWGNCCGRHAYLTLTISTRWEKTYMYLLCVLQIFSSIGLIFVVPVVKILFQSLIDCRDTLLLKLVMDILSVLILTVCLLPNN